MNSVMSAGLHHRWRARAVEMAEVGPGSRTLDVCCGTGDLALELKRAVGPEGEVVALDFSAPMLAIARQKTAKAGLAIEYVQGNALDLPFEDGRFDAATVGFGVRNVADLEVGLRELRRVLRNGGRLGILEITTPRGALAPFYRVWFDRVVPLLGKILPGGAAYTYLPASVRRFPAPADLAALLERTGFANVQYRLFAGGIVALHTGEAA